MTIVTDVKDVLISCSNFLYKHYQKLPSAAEKINALFPSFPSSLLPAKITSDYKLPLFLKEAKFQALINSLEKKEKQEGLDNAKLENAETFYKENKLSPAPLISFYVKTGNIENAQSLIETFNSKLSAKEFVSFAKEIQVQIKKLDQAGAKKPWEKFLNEVLKSALEAADKIEAKWKMEYSYLSDPCKKEMSRLEEKLTLYVEIAECHKNNENVTLAIMILNKGSMIWQRERPTRTHDELNFLYCKLYYLYAQAYHLLKEEKSVTLCLSRLSSDLEIIHNSNLNLKILNELVESHTEIISTWEAGQKFFEGLLEKFNKFRYNETELLSLLNIFHTIPTLKEKCVEILKKISVKGVVDCFTLAKFYREFEEQVPEELAAACLAKEKQMENSNEDLYRSISLIEQTVMHNHKSGKHEEIVNLLDSLCKQSLNIEEGEQMLFMCHLVSLYQKIGEKEKGDQMFSAFMDSSPKLRTKSVGDTVRIGRKLFAIDKKELALHYLNGTIKSIISNIKEGEAESNYQRQLLEIFEIYREIDPDQALEALKKYEDAHHLMSTGEKLQVKQMKERCLFNFCFAGSILAIGAFFTVTAARRINNRYLLVDRAVTWFRQKRG